MAEETAKKKPEEAKAEKKAAGGGLMGKTSLVIGGVMLIEAVVLFAGFKFLGAGAHPVEGANLLLETGGHGGEAAAATETKAVEMPVVEFRAPNKVSGRLLLIDVSIFMVVDSSKQAQVQEILKSREALIKDRIRTIIAQSDPEKLGGEAEPGLETLRRQVKYQLDEIIGEGMVQEVLVPRCIPIRAD